MSDSLSIAVNGLAAQERNFSAIAGRIARLPVAPDVDIAEELVHMIEVKTAFKANLATIKTGEEMQKSLLDVIA